MPDDTVTLALDGTTVPFRTFSRAVMHFEQLIRALSSDLAQDRISWTLDDVIIGSAIITQRGETTEQTALAEVVHAYPDVARVIVGDHSARFSPRVMAPAVELRSLISGPVTGIRFVTSSEETSISPTDEPRLDSLRSRGVIEGRVETLARRGTLRFTLYDVRRQRPVFCYATAEQENLLRGIWGKRVLVEGTIYRHPLTGQPHSIRDVTDVTILSEVEPGQYKLALG